MKSLIVLVGIMGSFGIMANERIAMKEYKAVPGMDYAFELVTDQYQKVVLDCQGFAGGMRFYNHKKLKHEFYLDNYKACPAMHEFIKKSTEDELPVCLDIEADPDTQKETLTVSNEEDCQ
jgi:hypothetical protein